MSLEVTGKLLTKFPTQSIKENFSKREFVLELTDEGANGMVYTNFASFQLVNTNCNVIDQFNEGELLKVSFNIRGNRWEKDGNVRYITNLNAWRVERANSPASVGSYGTPTPPPAQSSAGPASTTDQAADDLPF